MRGRQPDAGSSDGHTSGSQTTRPNAVPAQDSFDGDESLPKRIGPYLVVRTLGRGGMGTVVLGYHGMLDRAVAIKLLHRNYARSAESRARMIREGQAMARLSHPNVAHVYDVGEHDGRIYLAMEYVRGDSLRQWLRRRGRSPARIIDVFVRAGLGLHAAHEAGVVHRDFKPDNVMVGEDGTVRVVDFGLALAFLEHGSSTEGSASIDTFSPSAEHSSLFEHLTEDGMVLGTPAYMAPEQHAGRPCDPRADQFGFCVSLYEALWGKRPFPGNSAEQVATAITCGRFTPPPGRSGVPSYVTRAIVRGLSTRPADRWPSVADLVAALQGRPPSLRRRAFAVATVAGVLLTAGAMLGRVEADAPCSTSGEEVERSWNDDVRQRLSQTLGGDGRSSAAVERSADEYFAAWARSRQNVCMATVRGEQSPALLDLRMQCLDRDIARIEVLLAELRPGPTMYRAALALEALEPPSRCERLTPQTLEMQRPEDPSRAVQVAGARMELARSFASEMMGFDADALRDAERALGIAEVDGFEPLLAEALDRRGQVLSQLGRFDDARRDLERALWMAVRLQYDEVALRSAIGLAHVVGMEQGQLEPGRVWAEHAVAIGSKLGDWWEAPALISRGNLRHSMADNQGARADLERALAMLPEDKIHHRALCLMDLGVVAMGEGNYDEAERHTRASIDLLQAMYGENHPDIGTALTNLGDIEFSRNDLQAARGTYERALRLIQRTGRPDYPDVAIALANVGGVASAMKDYDAALDTMQRALELFVAALGEDHPNVAQLQCNLGSTHMERGDHERALQYFAQAIAGWEAALGADHPRLGYALSGAGRSLHALGRTSDARERLERALAIREHHRVPPAEQAYTKFALAEVLASSSRPDDRVRARELARAAADHWQSVGNFDEDAAKASRLAASLADADR